jgi:hypothetical protein
MQKKFTIRIAVVAFVALSALGLTSTSPNTHLSEGDLAIDAAWSDVKASIGNVLFATAYASRAEALGLDDGDGEGAVALAQRDVLTAVGHVLFAYDFRACERSRGAASVDDQLALR